MEDINYLCMEKIKHPRNSKLASPKDLGKADKLTFF